MPVLLMGVEKGCAGNQMFLACWSSWLGQVCLFLLFNVPDPQLSEQKPTWGGLSILIGFSTCFLCKLPRYLMIVWKS